MINSSRSSAVAMEILPPLNREALAIAVTIEHRRGTIAEAAATTAVDPTVAISTKKASTAVSTRVDQVTTVVSTAIGTSSILLSL